MLRDTGTDESQFIISKSKAGRSGIFNRLSRIARTTQ
jgi:hypothetical protein